MKNKNTWIILLASLIVLGVAAAVVVSGNKNSAPKADLDSFAQCLTQKGGVMYGAEWCGYCQKQRNLFGLSFKFITYIECPNEPKQCVAAGIDGYPTWIFGGGLKLIGLQSLENLAQVSGCSL